MSFIHLHCHSYFSMMRGLLSPEDLARLASQLRMDSLALTDVNGLYGWVEFAQVCRHYGVKPLCGVDLIAPDARAVLLAQNWKGYSRLCRIISDRHLEGDFSLTRSLLEDRRHLSVLTRDLRLLDTLRRETGDQDLSVEILPFQENLSCLRFAKEKGLKPVAANDVYFKDHEDEDLHRILRAIDGNTKLFRLSPEDCAAPERFFCGEKWMREKLSYVPEAVDNAAELAASLQGRWDFGETVFPPFEEFSDPEAYFTLRWKCYQGARRRYGRVTSKVKERLEYELGVIRKKNFTHYFLVVDDIVGRAPRTCGRGSVAASIVSYCLGITHVDPLRHNLFFERFLNPDRKDPPDADIDFPWDERDDILDYIFKKYGPTRAAMVCNHVRFQPRLAVREVAKVFGFPDPEITRLTEKWFRFPPGRFPEPWDKIFEWAGRLGDLPRHLSVHSGGVVIVPDDLRRYVPLERAPKGVNILQWEKDQTEDFGLVKIDILGNRSLSVVRDGIKAVYENTGRRIDFEYPQAQSAGEGEAPPALPVEACPPLAEGDRPEAGAARAPSIDPTEDPATQEMLKVGDTMGVFYIESPATRLLQQKAGVGDYEHLVIHSSIIRPASHRYINEYVERLRGKPYASLHPLMGDILKDSYGLMVYQEDVTKTAMALAGFSAVEGDGLRKALSKKRPEKWLPEYRERFFEGALGRGVPPSIIEAAWGMIESFSGYSFCKPHSASYALVSFQSAYLRAHYPAEFMAAVISNGGGFYSTFAYLSEARRMGLRILPPDVNLSEWPYRGEGLTLRTGLMQLKGVREQWIKDLLEERRKGPYLSLEDFLSRVGGELTELRILIKAGCFDSIAAGLNRPQLLWKLFQLRSPQKEGAGLNFERPPPWIPAVKDYSPLQKLKDEAETLGLLQSRHPMSLYQDFLDQTPHVPGARLKEFIGERVRMAGWLITGKVVLTKRDETMEFMTFEDLTAIYETTFFPRSYALNGPLLNQREPFWLMGKVEDDHGAVTLNVERLSPFTPPILEAGDPFHIPTIQGARKDAPSRRFEEALSPS